MVVLTKAQWLAKLESRRLWTIILGLAVAGLQWWGHPMPQQVFLSFEGLFGVLFAGDSAVAMAHAHSDKPATTATVTGNVTGGKTS